MSFFSIISAQTADEIITSHLEKTGGISNWNALNTIKLKGDVVFGLKEIYKIEIIQKNPNLNKTIIFVGKKKIILEAFDGKNGYKTNNSGKKEIIKNYIAESFDSDLLNYTQKGFVAELMGKDKVNNQECYKISVSKAKNKTLYYFNTSNYNLIKEIKADETLEYSNYKKVGNLFFAYRIESTSEKKDGDYSLILNSIEINKSIEDSAFKF